MTSMTGGNNMILSQGGVYLVKLNPSKKNEVGKVRPAVLLTNQKILSAEPPVVFICPLSSQSLPKFKSLHVEIAPRDRLLKTSFALVEHCHAIALARISSPRIAQMQDEETRAIIKRLNLLIDVD